MQHLRRRTVFGLGWSAAMQLLGKILQFSTTIVLARLLTPGEFGLVGMIVVFTGFAAGLADMGLGASIIQKKEPSDRSLDAAFWMIVAVGTCLTCIFSAAASLVAGFYGEPQLRLLTIVVSLTFVLSSLSVVQTALLTKALDFRTRFWIEGAAIVVSGIVALGLALAGAGVWSLAAQVLSETAIRSAAYWITSPWRPRLSYDLAAARELLTFGRHVVGFNIIVYWAQNFDKLVIGRQFGSASLGIYNLADRLMRFPLTNVTSITGSVMFPALSTLQNEVESVRRVYLRANRMIALLTFPMMLGLCALAEPAILLVYGEQWRSAIDIVRVLCLAGMAQSVYNTASWIFLSRGRPDLLFRLGVLSMVVRVVGVLIGLQWGLVGVAWAYVLGGFAGILYPTWFAAGRLIELRFSVLLRNVSAPFFCASGMAIFIAIADYGLFSEQANWLRLSAGTSIGIAVYSSLIVGFRLTAWTDVRNLILEFGGHNHLVRSLFAGGSAN